MQRLGTLVAVLAAAACGAFPPSPQVERAAVPQVIEIAPPAGPVEVTKAIERSLDYLERDGRSWMEGRTAVQDGTGCVSCHHVAYAVWSHNEASRHVPIARERIDALTRTALQFLLEPNKSRPMSAGPLVLGTSDEARRDGNADWDGLVMQVATSQEGAGHWRARGQFPEQRRDLRETDAVATMWTMLALQSAGRLDDATAARAWSTIADLEGGETTEWLAVRTILERTHGRAPRVQELLEALRSRQNPDGGWGWRAGETSNAHSTGQVLYALGHVADPDDATGDAALGPVLAHARGYLLARQRDDGTWDVPSNLISAEPSEARDYIYTYWGTAWATIGLARSLPAPSAEPGIVSAARPL